HPPNALPWLVAGWILGVVVLSLRLAVGWFQIHQARTRSGESLEAQLGARLRELQRRLRLSRPVRLVKSALVEVPTVIGWFRPMILLPASALTGLSPVQLDLILAHELAHLRRWDHWVNLLQIAIETLLFYHPAVWWVSRCVREEREHCCDELAVAVCGNRLAYAQALATLEELRQAPADLALAAAGGSLLSLPDDERGGGRLAAAGSALMVVGMLMFAVGVGLYATSERLFTSTAKVSVMPPQSPGEVLANAQGALQRYPFYLATELERMRSRPMLQAVADRLGLAKKWAPAADGPELDPRLVVDRLHRCLDLRQLVNTSLIEIRVRDRDPAQAAEIANAIARNYVEWRLANRMQETYPGIRVLQENLTNQTEKVRDLQTKVDKLRTELGIEESASDSLTYQTSLEREMVSSLAQQLTYTRSEYILYNTKLEELRKLDEKTLQRAILTAVPGEEILPGLLKDLATVDQTLAKLRQDYADEYPEVKRTIALKNEVENQIHFRLQGMLTGLEKQVIALKARYDEVQRSVEEGRKKVAEETKRARDFSYAKRDLDNEQRIRDALYLRILQERVDANIPPTAVVEIVEPAEPATISRRTSYPLDVSLMAAGVFTTLGGLSLRLGGRKPAVPAAPAA
ncbi:MAG: hypothetical protein M1541_14700, partial [Acidobacteria bacterium]|nr:hypothetical protein [Acidobacteriota bacterium]